MPQRKQQNNRIEKEKWEENDTDGKKTERILVEEWKSFWLEQKWIQRVFSATASTIIKTSRCLRLRVSAWFVVVRSNPMDVCQHTWIRRWKKTASPKWIREIVKTLRCVYRLLVLLLFISSLKVRCVWMILRWLFLLLPFTDIRVSLLVMSLFFYTNFFFFFLFYFWHFLNQKMLRLTIRP